jgi:hypothetical protein
LGEPVETPLDSICTSCRPPAELGRTSRPATALGPDGASWGSPPRPRWTRSAQVVRERPGAVWRDGPPHSIGQLSARIQARSAWSGPSCPALGGRGPGVWTSHQACRLRRAQPQCPRGHRSRSPSSRPRWPVRPPIQTRSPTQTKPSAQKAARPPALTAAGRHGSTTSSAPGHRPANSVRTRPTAFRRRPPTRLGETSRATPTVPRRLGPDQVERLSGNPARPSRRLSDSAVRTKSSGCRHLSGDKSDGAARASDELLAASGAGLPCPPRTR